MGHLVPILMSGRSGYRSEGRIPTNAEETKRALENYLHANASTQPQPGMAGVRSQEQLAVANAKQPPSGRAVFPSSIRPDRR
jgi:hypothetical protein